MRNINGDQLLRRNSKRLLETVGKLGHDCGGNDCHANFTFCGSTSQCKILEIGFGKNGEI